MAIEQTTKETKSGCTQSEKYFPLDKKGQQSGKLFPSRAVLVPFDLSFDSWLENTKLTFLFRLEKKKKKNRDANIKKNKRKVSKLLSRLKAFVIKISRWITNVKTVFNWRHLGKSHVNSDFSDFIFNGRRFFPFFFFFLSTFHFQNGLQKLRRVCIKAHNCVSFPGYCSNLVYQTFWFFNFPYFLLLVKPNFDHSSER